MYQVKVIVPIEEQTINDWLKGGDYSRIISIQCVSGYGVPLGSVVHDARKEKCVILYETREPTSHGASVSL